MNSKLFLSNLPAIIVVVIFFVIIGLLYFFNLRKKRRKSPLTRELLRSPGESLRIESENLTLDIVFYFMMLFLFPIMIFSTYLSQVYFGAVRENSVIIGMYAFVALVSIGLCSYKLWKLLKERNNYQLGLDCEIAVGQELNQLMLEGCKVFHDFPVEEFNKKFNIDHIVVSPKGVFAVETKGRAKPTNEETVVYDGKVLKFPGWTESEPLEQARRNAKWLSKWLSSAVDAKIQVNSVIAIPGWYIKREITDDMFVFNGKNPENLLKRNDYLSPELMKSISHQLEQKCRDVEPTAYNQGRKK